MKSLHIMLKPTLDCNLHCRYCYHQNVRTQQKMTIGTFKNIINKLQKYDNITINWHGGEPLLMGLEFFNECIQIQKDNKLNIKNTIQSNLTLLNDDWIKFFKDNNFNVGTSLDGIKEIHNFNRCSSFDNVITAIKKLQLNKINVSIVCTITPEFAPYLYENFTLFKNLNSIIRINPMVNKNINLNCKLYEFCLKFFYDMVMNNEKMNIQPLTNIVDFLNGKHTIGCLYGNNCVGGSDAVLPNGDVYFCGRLSNIYGCLGNVNNIDFNFGLDNPITKKYFDENVNRINKCKICEYFSMCRGGCFNNSLETGIDIFCETYKGIFKHILLRRNAK